MLIFPAIDLKNGRCVRLQQGDPQAETVYSNDPAAVAETWTEQGAEWLHVINLDGALGDETKAARNLDALQSILDRVNTPLQFGGGLRTAEDIAWVLGLGVTRVILGSIAIDRPRQLVDLLARFGPEQIVVSIDAQDGKVATHGWRNITDLEAMDLAAQLQTRGVRRIVYTDIARDGMLTGVNAEACARLATQTGLKVIAAGGVAGLEDVRRIKAVEGDNVEGLIIGQALYAGRLTLPEALKVASA
ncbi:MAG: 1-(5-phosphoribosyl)-5-[(5-phosphoribosylamino)methylideneamino]imidazole-4-carboxamide isomerase [Anaerolineae bacterium]